MLDLMLIICFVLNITAGLYIYFYLLVVVDNSFYRLINLNILF